MTDNALTKPNDYPLLNADTMEHMLMVFQENIGAGGVNALDLPRLKCPSGGQTTWILQTAEGEESRREIEGIVLSWRISRVFWKDSLLEAGTISNQPPDCHSTDSYHGIGDPGGSCIECPYAQFGSAGRGKGQACKQIRQILIVCPGESVPRLLNVPPTSLRNASQYFLMLASRGAAYWEVTTRIRLERATSQGGTAYARMLFSSGRQLTNAEKRVLHPYHAQMRALLAPAPIEARDYISVAEPPAQPAPAADPEYDENAPPF